MNRLKLSRNATVLSDRVDSRAPGSASISLQVNMTSCCVAFSSQVSHHIYFCFGSHFGRIFKRSLYEMLNSTNRQESFFSNLKNIMDLGVDAAVGLWCEVTLVTDVKFDGVIYSYNPDQGLLVLMKGFQKKPSTKVINTRFIKSFELKDKAEDTEDALPDQLDTYAVLPSMRAGKSILKTATSNLKEAEQQRLAGLRPLAKSGASIGAYNVFVPLQRVYPGVTWDAEKNAIKVNETVYVEGNPGWDKPIAKIKDGAKAIRDDHSLNSVTATQTTVIVHHASPFYLSIFLFLLLLFSRTFLHEVESLETASPAQAVTMVTSQSTFSRKAARDKEREERLHGKLTDLTFDTISCSRDGHPDFVVPGVLHNILGSKSQFDARTGRMKDILPALTIDCCQTFATLSAVLLSSLGRAEVLLGCCNTSTVNYLLYISAWLHQLTKTSWPKRGTRPSVSDLNACLQLNNFFPSKVEAEKFHIIFYNQSEKVVELLRQICMPPQKRQRDSPSSAQPGNPVCGYVVVSGDYTVSIFGVTHQILEEKKAGYSKAWNLYICDSHGTQPWSRGKASISGISFGIPCEEGGLPAESVLNVEDGLHYFSTILFTLLEEHRTAVPRPDYVPYMTWTPLTRRRSLFYSGEDLKKIIQEHWLPKTLSQPAVAKQVTQTKCFSWDHHRGGGQLDTETFSWFRLAQLQSIETAMNLCSPFAVALQFITFYSRCQYYLLILSVFFCLCNVLAIWWCDHGQKNI
eukprot:gene5475-3949_t